MHKMHNRARSKAHLRCVLSRNRELPVWAVKFPCATRLPGQEPAWKAPRPFGLACTSCYMQNRHPRSRWWEASSANLGSCSFINTSCLHLEQTSNLSRLPRIETCNRRRGTSLWSSKAVAKRLLELPDAQKGMISKAGARLPGVYLYK